MKSFKKFIDIICYFWDKVRKYTALAVKYSSKT